MPPPADPSARTSTPWRARRRERPWDGRSEVEHGIHEPSIADLLFPAINFTIFVFVLVRFLAGPIREFFRERTERLRDGLEAGKRAQSEAAELRAQLARDLEALPGM